jgi:NTP pyrophosphatase (non-canonical NTP hydrolase)
MHFSEYEEVAMSTAVYGNAQEGVDGNLVYPALGLAGEAGEFVDKVKKNWRNNQSMTAANLTIEQKIEFAKELGDSMWYITACAKELGFTLQEIAQINMDKLLDRRKRGVIKSEGDNR